MPDTLVSIHSHTTKIRVQAMPNLWQLFKDAPEQHSVIHVRNLQTSLAIGRDAWGRQGKLQPVLISISVSLKQPFESASSEDAVTESTIHYGTLSKAILEFCGQQEVDAENMRAQGIIRDRPLSVFSNNLIQHLNMPISGKPAILHAKVSWLQVKITLPKASLQGSGICFSDTMAWSDSPTAPPTKVSSLHLRDLQISAIIGVNTVERLAKQVVVANVTLEPWSNEADAYNELEQIVVKVSYSQSPSQSSEG